MLDVLSTNHYIIIFSSIIIISYFFNSYSKKTELSVLMLIVLGMIFGFYMEFQNRFSFILEVLGTVGLILIVLEGNSWFGLLKSNVPIIFKSFAASRLPLGVLLISEALLLNSFFQLDIGVFTINNGPPLNT